MPDLCSLTRRGGAWGTEWVNDTCECLHFPVLSIFPLRLIGWNILLVSEVNVIQQIFYIPFDSWLSSNWLTLPRQSWNTGLKWGCLSGLKWGCFVGFKVWVFVRFKVRLLVGYPTQLLTNPPATYCLSCVVSPSVPVHFKCLFLHVTGRCSGISVFVCVHRSYVLGWEVVGCTTRQYCALWWLRFKELPVSRPRNRRITSRCLQAVLCLEFCSWF